MRLRAIALALHVGLAFAAAHQSFRAESKEHVPESGISSAIARSYKYHSTGNSGAGLSYVAALSPHTIDGLVIARRIVLP